MGVLAPARLCSVSQQHNADVEMYKDGKWERWLIQEQAGAQLCQAQIKLSLVKNWHCYPIVYEAQFVFKMLYKLMLSLIWLKNYGT